MAPSSFVDAKVAKETATSASSSSSRINWDALVTSADDNISPLFTIASAAASQSEATSDDDLSLQDNTSMTSLPPWSHDGPMPFGISVAGGTLGTVVLVLGVFGNAVVILAIWRYRPLRKASNLFVTSLAFCDLFHSAFVRPLYVISYIRGDWQFGAHICVYALISSNLAILESILHVTSIAFHRYVILVHPRLAVCFQRRLAIVLMLGAIYVLPLTVVLVQSSSRLNAQLTMGRDVLFNRRIMFCSFVRHSEFRLSGVVKKMSFVIVAALFIFYCYIRIYHLVRRRGQRLSVHGSFSPIRLRRELNLLRTVIAVFLMFVFTYLPITLIYGLDTSRTLPYVAYFVGVMLLWTSTGVNWIIYGLMNVQYSRAYRFLLCGAVVDGTTRATSIDGPSSNQSKQSQNQTSVRRENSFCRPLASAAAAGGGAGGGADSKRVSRPSRMESLPEVNSTDEGLKQST